MNLPNQFNPRVMWIPVAAATYFPTGVMVGRTLAGIVGPAATVGALATDSVFNGFDRPTSETYITGIYATVPSAVVTNFISFDVAGTTVTDTFELSRNYENLWIPILGAWSIVKAGTGGECMVTYCFKKENF